MENKEKYYITQKQLNQIKRFKSMFELNADSIRELCKSEREDIFYGFELGNIHSHLRDCFIEIMELESEIENQNIKLSIIKSKKQYNEYCNELEYLISSPKSSSFTERIELLLLLIKKYDEENEIKGIKPNIRQRNEVENKKITKAWMVLAKTQPKVYCANYPIYWRKDVADKEAKKFGGTVVRCDVRW